MNNMILELDGIGRPRQINPRESSPPCPSQTEATLKPRGVVPAHELCSTWADWSTCVIAL